MIGFLDGKLAVRTLDGCMVDVGGVGYRLMCSTATLTELPPVGARVRLWTHMHVREEVLALFGFASEAEQHAFEALIGVAGVGPKVALQVCSALAPDALRRALVTDDIATLASVPGIGKKTAQRMVLDLKERLALPDLEVVDASGPVAAARSALENLGYSASEVRDALSQVAAAPDERVEAVVKSALRVLA